MADWERDQARIDAAMDALFKIPGVHSVYVGRRYRNALPTEESALCVLVRRKKPLEEVAPSERVPSEVAGIPTDVMEADPPRRLQGVKDNSEYTQPSESVLPTTDDEEYPRLRGGIACEGGGGHGTLGCFARATDPQNLNKIVLLSNYHVLVNKGAGVGTTVYQARSCCCCCGRKVGGVLRSHQTTTGAFFKLPSHPATIDAAIALVNPGIECLGEIQTGTGSGDPTELITGVRADAQITDGSNGTPHLLVKKRGSRTGPTTGRIESRNGASHSSANTPKDKDLAFRRQLVIDPWDQTSASGLFRFGAGGDSGSVVMTQTGGEVVGLLWSVFVFRPVPGSDNLVIVKGVASNIHEVTAALNISVLPSPALGTVFTNPAPAPSDTFTPAPLPQPIARNMLDQARLDLERTVHGRSYAELVRRHHSEVWRLVRENRRVGAIWKRYGGQTLLQALINAIARPDEPIPSMIGARPVDQSTARIAAMLKRYGSAALARDVDAYEHTIVGLCGCTYNQLLARLRAGEP
ncbi:MAG TPA: hypothetical protein VH394_23585 [Thermoanaerobaculia bacterium]|jgi:hypothetical protein|nr:hypothetical protein [Thermoanaerobaculia bacterium]